MLSAARRGCRECRAIVEVPRFMESRVKAGRCPAPAAGAVDDRNEVEALGSVLGGDPKAAVRVDPRGCAILYGARTKQSGEYSVLVGAEGAAQRCDRGLGFGE